MKKTKLFIILIALVIVSCNSSGTRNQESVKEVQNEGIFLVENGRGQKDSVQYNCIGCHENLSYELFEKTVQKSTEVAKNGLKNPLSFRPVKIDFIILKEDSLYYFDSDKKIDSVFTVFATYKYIGQNAYGTEMSGDQLITFNLVDGEIQDISEKIKKDDLKFDGKYINRTLSLVRDDKFIEITPTKSKDIIVESSLTCVDKGTWLIIRLSDEREIKLTSWNDFNCNGKSYFYWFNKSQIDLLKNNLIESISLIDDKSIGIIVPENSRDYFQQLMKLY